MLVFKYDLTLTAAHVYYALEWGAQRVCGQWYIFAAGKRSFKAGSGAPVRQLWVDDGWQLRWAKGRRHTGGQDTPRERTECREPRAARTKGRRHTRRSYCEAGAG